MHFTGGEQLAQNNSPGELVRRLYMCGVNVDYGPYPEAHPGKPAVAFSVVNFKSPAGVERSGVATNWMDREIASAVKKGRLGAKNGGFKARLVCIPVPLTHSAIRLFAHSLCLVPEASSRFIHAWFLTEVVRD